MGIWQVAWLGLMLFSLSSVMSKHGERRNDRYNFWTSLIAFGIEFVMLYFGGFFS